MDGALLARPEVARFVEGLTDGIVIRAGDRAWTLRDGAIVDGQEDGADVVVHVTPEDLVAASARAELGPLDDEARFHLLRVLLGPILVASAHHKHLWAWPFRTGQAPENVFHVTLRGPQSEARFTLLMVNTDWLWLEGHRATPIRSLVLDPEAAHELAATVLRAMREDSQAAWTWFTPWWWAFREAHGTLHVDAPPPPVGHGHDHPCD